MDRATFNLGVSLTDRCAKSLLLLRVMNDYYELIASCYLMSFYVIC